jgi:beta-xylosidase
LFISSNCRLHILPLAALLLLIALAARLHSQPFSFGDQGDGAYLNPILPADYSDIDAIRVGGDYYAISSTFQYSPGMVVLHSKDLVNWEIIGHVVPDLNRISPEMNWSRMNRAGTGIWAGAIRFHAGRFWVYFCTPDEGYFMTSAASPAGPWEPVVHFLSAPGWDDPAPFWDDDGQGYLLGTHYAPDPADGIPYKIHLFKLTAGGKGILPGFDRVIHQSKGSEANKLYKWNGLYYHYFSEVHREGRVAMMERSASLSGPWEERQLNHVNPRVDREPNQGGILQTEKGDWWFLTHQGTGAWEGRALCLLPVTWKDGWPILGAVGADGIGSMVWKARKPIDGFPPAPRSFFDDFSDSNLKNQWEWNYQPRAEKWSLTGVPRRLRLQAFPPLQPGNLLGAGNTLTQRILNTGSGVITVKLDVSSMADGQAAGLCHFGGHYAWLGVTQAGNRRRITYSANGEQTAGPPLPSTTVWLRSIVADKGETTWAYSFDGSTFVPFGKRYKFEWAHYRGDRVGIFTYNDRADAGAVDVDWFRYDD